jgi:hypothetical protein
MAAPTWVLGPATLANADDALHAGITVDLLRGNLLRAIEQSAYDLQCFHNDGDLAISQAFTSTDYTHFTDYNPQMITMRIEPDSSWRNIVFSLEAKVDTGTATVRAYLRPVFEETPSLDATHAFAGEAAYTTLTVTATSWGTRYSGTITPDTARRVPTIPSESPDVSDYPVCYIVLVVSASTSLTLDVRAPRIKESVSV